ncbi:peptidase inhibitor family I36 protein [Actinomadura sp. 3N508]|uniref:caspase, EACC1-associated type n=1 Tax=Actinomadura sp. 3N508 TaxID=3375153 RepID=UPI003793EA78
MAEPRAELADSRAVLISTARYRDERFLPLPAAANSLNGMLAMLLDPGLGGWPGECVTELLDPEDAQDLILRIRDIAMRTSGTLLLYYVGHGELTPKTELALTVVNTVFGHEDVTGVEYSRIRDALLDSPARVKIVILDCCYSGKAPPSLSTASVAGLTEISGAYTLTAAEYAAHVAPLEEQEHTSTSFTGELLTLVRDGLPGGASWLTLGDLYPELRRRLHIRGLPEPSQHGSDTAHQFPFVRNAAGRPGGSADRGDRSPAALKRPAGSSEREGDRPGRPRSLGRTLRRRLPVRQTLVAISALAAVSATVAATTVIVQGWRDVPPRTHVSDTTPPENCPQYRMCFYTGPNYDGRLEHLEIDYARTPYCHNTPGVFRSVFNNADQNQQFWQGSGCPSPHGWLVRYGTGERNVTIRSYRHT